MARNPKQLLPLVAWAAAALGAGGCAGGGSTVVGPTPASSVSPVGSPQASAAPAAKPAVTPPTGSLASIHTWTSSASLTVAKPAAILTVLTSRPADLLIVDPTLVVAPTPGKDQAKDHVTPPVKPLAALQQTGQRRVLALLDISALTRTDPQWEASWVGGKTGKPSATAPSWLGTAEPQAPGVYDVQYWASDWQKRLSSELDTLIAAGYDGVCLQGVGRYQSALKAHPTAGTEMAAFVETLAARARKSRPSVSIVVEDGTGLPASLKGPAGKDYVASVDGVLAHSVFYPGDKPVDNALAPNTDVMAALDTFQKAGKAILVTERLTDPDKIADFLTRAKSKGYLPDAALAAPTVPPAPTNGPRVADNTL